MAEHQNHVDVGHMQGPENTLPMVGGQGPFGNLEMGGMFTVVKVRDELAPDNYRDPGWYSNPRGTLARRISDDADFGSPARRGPTPQSAPPPETAPVDHSKMKHGT